MFAKGMNLARFVFAALLLLTAILWGHSPAAAAPDGGHAVYVLTNASAGNAVAVFNRAPDGTLTAAGTVATGGLGTGAGTGSQGALALSEDGNWLYAVNPGSDDISVFDVRPHGLQLVQQISSGGDLPISLTVDHHLLYILNAGAGGSNITGFVVGPHGLLAPLPGSTQPLTSASGPAQVSFSPDGRVLVVTLKATSMIDTFTVGHDGRPSAPQAHPSVGTTPFGFAFAGDTLVVSEAASQSTSSYALDRNGSLTPITSAATTHQAAPCWVAATPNGRYAYVINAGAGSVSGYGVAHNGRLTELNADGRTGVTGTGSHPTDAAVTENGRYLYVLSAGTNGITAFQVANDGSLTAIAGATGLPTYAVGLVAR